ncbi:NUDIX domain-containing protein [Priestia megaterium]|uniref:NUDIX domain-containing protein n=1 Tax=Priestia megaterium TaxID=1404 RepID=UPI002E1D3AB1|nr:NUDIX domain-containing protein [Priestia megaterium]MED3976113.1 NUDIX domain-containing protein [Priestia megaterium]
MPTEKTLFETHWTSIVKKTMDNGSQYEFLRMPWCNSEGIAILPYRFKGKPDAEGVFEFLGRFEVCPAHSDDTELCSITGGLDKDGESAIVTAWRELQEEGGYKVPVENIVSLGSVRPSKASDTTTHLFAVDLGLDYEKVEATGDGTLCEEGAYCKWVSRDDILLSKDPLLHAIYSRLYFEPSLKKFF